MSSSACARERTNRMDNEAIGSLWDGRREKKQIVRTKKLNSHLRTLFSPSLCSRGKWQDQREASDEWSRFPPTPRVRSMKNDPSRFDNSEWTTLRPFWIYLSNGASPWQQWNVWSPSGAMHHEGSSVRAADFRGAFFNFVFELFVLRVYSAPCRRAAGRAYTIRMRSLGVDTLFCWRSVKKETKEQDLTWNNRTQYTSDWQNWISLVDEYEYE